jgi:hypothetical protein
MAETPLPDFEDTPVYAASATIGGLGDGLSKAMATDPAVYHQHQEVTWVVRTICTDVRHPVQKESDGLTRHHVFKATVITPIDDEVVDAALADQKRKNDELKGVKELPFEEAEPEADPAADPAQPDAAPAPV